MAAQDVAEVHTLHALVAVTVLVLEGLDLDAESSGNVLVLRVEGCASLSHFGSRTIALVLDLVTAGGLGLAIGPFGKTLEVEAGAFLAGAFAFLGLGQRTAIEKVDGGRNHEVLGALLTLGDVGDDGH